MKKNFLCVLSLVVSGIALVVSLLRNSTWDVDYPSLLVSVLSALVTVLIGWNIYTVMDLRKTKAELAAMSYGISKQLQGDMACIENSLWMVYHYLYLQKDQLGLPFRYIQCGLLCLYHASEYGDIRTCEVVIDALVQSLVAPQRISVSQSSKQQLLLALSKVRNQDKLPNFPTLAEKIALIGVR